MATEHDRPHTTEKPTPEARVQWATQEIAEVLRKHGCRLVPVLQQDTVGSGPGRGLLLKADAMIVAEPSA